MRCTGDIDLTCASKLTSHSTSAILWWLLWTPFGGHGCGAVGERLAHRCATRLVQRQHAERGDGAEQPQPYTGGGQQVDHDGRQDGAEAAARSAVAHAGVAARRGVLLCGGEPCDGGGARRADTRQEREGGAEHALECAVRQCGEEDEGGRYRAQEDRPARTPAQVVRQDLLGGVGSSEWGDCVAGV